jgi:NDP-sugar pyrophosphorylase family protein
MKNYSESMKIKNVLILAAGRGNRMRPLSDIIPKAMAPYKGDTLIGNTLNNFKNGLFHIHVTVGYKSAILGQYLLTGGLVNSLINTTGQDNAWWIFNSLLSNVDKPVLVLTCDNITELDINFIEDQYNRLNQPSCMIVPVKPIDSIAGDYITHDNGTIVSLERDKPSDCYCSGIQVLNPLKINKLIKACDNFYDVWRQLIDLKELKASNIYPNSWFSVDTLEQLIIHENA